MAKSSAETRLSRGTGISAPDFAAARSKESGGQIEALKGRGICPKDILRAANVRLLPMTDSDVKRDRQLINDKKALSAVLLYRDPALRKLIIVDGYHRLCAVYSFDEQAMIPCQIV